MPTKRTAKPAHAAEAESWVDKATAHLITAIAICQQNIAAMYEINWRMTDRDRHAAAANDPALHAAQDVIWKELHRQLAEAWNDLSYMAPISAEAMALLRARTRTWFEHKDHGIMNFVGHYGSYYTADEVAFRREVLRMFGAKEETPESPTEEAQL